MPTITTVDMAWQPSPTTFTDAEARRFDTAMFLGDGSVNGVRGGVVRHGDTSLAVSINGSDQVTVQAGAAVIPAATGLGVYRGALSAATSAVAIDARNATNPRIDLVVFRATGAVDIITGTPGVSPTAPAVPAQTVELGRLNIPAVAGGAAVADPSWRSYATALGATLFVETSARLPGSGNQKGQRATALDTGRGYRWDGTAWGRSTDGFVQSATYSHVYAATTQAQTRAVVFPEAYSAAPKVVCGVGDERFTVARKNVTTAGFDVVTYYLLGNVSVAGVSVDVTWQAHL